MYVIVCLLATCRSIGVILNYTSHTQPHSDTHTHTDNEQQEEGQQQQQQEQQQIVIFPLFRGTFFLHFEQTLVLDTL